MKHIKKFNEELNPETYKNTGLKIKAFGQDNRSDKLLRKYAEVGENLYNFINVIDGKESIEVYDLLGFNTLIYEEHGSVNKFYDQNDIETSELYKGIQNGRGLEFMIYPVFEKILGKLTRDFYIPFSIKISFNNDVPKILKSVRLDFVSSLSIIDGAANHVNNNKLQVNHSQSMIFGPVPLSKFYDKIQLNKFLKLFKSYVRKDDTLDILNDVFENFSTVDELEKCITAITNIDKNYLLGNVKKNQDLYIRDEKNK